MKRNRNINDNYKSGGDHHHRHKHQKYVPPYTKRHQEFMIDRIESLIDNVQHKFPSLVPILQEYVIDIQTNMPIL